MLAQWWTHRAGRRQLHYVAALLSACFTPVPSALGQPALLALGIEFLELAASQGQGAVHLLGASFAEILHVTEELPTGGKCAGSRARPWHPR